MESLDDRTAHETLTTVECVRLLETQFIGRIAAIDRGAPIVMPVTFVMVGTTVFFRTSLGSAFHEIVKDADVAFEVDSADPAYHTGWSVIGRGRSQQVFDPETRRRALALHLRPWARAGEPGLISIPLTQLTGRRIVQIVAG